MPNPDVRSDNERRAFPRFSAALRARIAGESGDRLDATTVNLSESGVLISGQQLPVGGRIQLELELGEGGWQLVQADVVRAGLEDDVPGALAARFADAATTGGRNAIRAFLRENFG